jgi:hypothetical protein
MGFRFSRRVSIIPGLRVNLSKLGASISIGTGAPGTCSGRMVARVTVGLPETGLYWRCSPEPGSFVVIERRATAYLWLRRERTVRRTA